MAYNLTNMAVKMFCPDNVVQLDDAGLPSLLVFIPKFKLSDVLAGGDDSTHPAFIVNGTEIPGFYYSKYQNVVYNGAAYSLPLEDPASYVNFDQAKEAAEAKGHGWHLSTAAEWAAVVLWCKKNNFLPYGNTSYGKDSREGNFKAVPTYLTADGRTCRVATGSGPLTWSHDKTPSGIWDLSGNMNEWQGGLRLVHGELQILANNDAADSDNPQNETSVMWKAINAADGSLVTPECTVEGEAVLSGATIRVNYAGNVWTYDTAITDADNSSRSCAFANLNCAAGISDAAKMLLRALALLPDEGTSAEDYEEDLVWWNNGAAECCVSRGGHWSHNATAGIFYIAGGSARTHSNTNIGFRAAYIPNIV